MPVLKAKGRSSVVDDRFFKLSEMQRFLEVVEKEVEDKASDGDADSADEEIDYFEGAVTDSEEDSSSETKTGRGMLYRDFFDPPEDVGVVPEGPQGASKGDSKEDRKGDRKEDRKEVEGVEEEEGEGGDNIDTPDIESSTDEGHSPDLAGEGEELGSKAARNGHMLGEGGDQDGESLSKHQKKQLMLQKRIVVLEDANLAKKSWQMGGETTAKKRPLNSLLEEDLSFDHMSRPPPVITEETTKSLEDTIKQRILDEAWDDVERRVKPVEKPYDYSKSRPLDQEKSKLSLAEVYEQEYVKQTQEATAEEGKEDKKHTEIREMASKLFHKLDALTNSHFTPKPPKPEVSIVANVPAIQMEEVAPVATSEATLLAPEELQAKSRRPDLGDTEKTETDRKRERRLKKQRKRLKTAEKKQREKISLKLRPGLGNKYSKKALDKRMKEREESEAVDKSLKSSSRFFAKLQEQVKEQVMSEKGAGRADWNKQRTSAQQYKL